MHDYYTCLNTPSHLPSSKPSTADTRKDGAAPLPNARDATSQDPPSHQWATWTKFGKALAPHNQEFQPMPPFPRRHYLTCPTYTSMITRPAPPKNRIMRAPTAFSCTHMPSTAPPQVIKRVGSPSPPIEAAGMWLYSMSSTPTTFARYPSRNGQQTNSCVPTAKPMSG